LSGKNILLTQPNHKKMKITTNLSKFFAAFVAISFLLAACGEAPATQENETEQVETTDEAATESSEEVHDHSDHDHGDGEHTEGDAEEAPADDTEAETETEGSNEHPN
jgi:hypothetical protein